MFVRGGFVFLALGVFKTQILRLVFVSNDL